MRKVFTPILAGGVLLWACSGEPGSGSNPDNENQNNRQVGVCGDGVREGAEELVDGVERILMDSSDREITSMEIGQHLMTELRKIDKVAYVRFASVYLDFKDVREFMDEISHLVKPN